MYERPDTTCLRLGTGVAVRALVHLGAGAKRPKCVLLHGNPGSLADWQQLWPSLANDMDLVAVDLPGFGLSPRPDQTPESLGLERMAEHALAVADALAWQQPVHLFGHSHGGGIAQIAAGRWPEKVASLVLLGTLGTPTHNSYRLLALPGAETVARVSGALLQARRFPGLSRWLVASVMQKIFSPEPVPARVLDDELHLLSRHPEILVAMVHVALGHPSQQLLDNARRIHCPTLFLHGAEDALVPPSAARSIHQRMESTGAPCHFELVPGAGHMLIRHRAAELADRITEHLRHQKALAGGTPRASSSEL